jgi:hypothetical protein
MANSTVCQFSGQIVRYNLSAFEDGRCSVQYAQWSGGTVVFSGSCGCESGWRFSDSGVDLHALADGEPRR